MEFSSSCEDGHGTLDKFAYNSYQNIEINRTLKTWKLKLRMTGKNILAWSAVVNTSILLLKVIIF